MRRCGADRLPTGYPSPLVEPPTGPLVLVSAVIVNWNAREQLLRCLASLRRESRPGELEVVVVDNCSSDGSVDAVRAAAPWARVIANEANRGLPAANNQGIAATTGSYVLISNPDVEYMPGAIGALRDVLERHPRAAFAVPQLVQDGTRQTSAGSLPSLHETVLGGLSARRGTSSTEGYWWHEWPHDEERPIGHGAEAAYLVRRTAIEQVGLQDQRYALDWEGIDWSSRMTDAGWEIWFVPQAVVEHAGGASIKQAQTRWVLLSNRGMYMYFADRRPAWQRPLLAALFAARACVKIGVIKLGVRIYDRAEVRKAIRRSADPTIRTDQPG